MKLKERERSARIASAGSGNSKQQEESEEETDEVADSMNAFKQSLANYNKEMSTKHEINDEDLVIEDSEVKNE